MHILKKCTAHGFGFGFLRKTTRGCNSSKGRTKYRKRRESETRGFKTEMRDPPAQGDGEGKPTTSVLSPAQTEASQKATRTGIKNIKQDAHLMHLVKSGADLEN